MSKYPILYKGDATDLFTLGLGPIQMLKATVTQERNGIFIFEGEILTDNPLFPLVLENYLIKADADHLLKDQRFRIKRMVPNHNGKAIIYAEHVSYLSRELTIKPEVSITGSAQVALSQWKASIVESNPFVVDSDIPTSNKTKWRIDKVENPRMALGGVEGSILDVWGGEYRFDNYHISLLQKRGTTAKTVLAYGRNITDFEQERNIANTYTSIAPYAIYTDDKENEVVVHVDGYVVDSQHINKYPNRVTLPVDFSSDFAHDEVPTKSRLLTLANQYIKANEIGVPSTSIKVSFVDLSKSPDYAEYAFLEQVNLCDDVRVYYPKLGVNTVAKVIRTVWNVLTESYDEIEIGQKRMSLVGQMQEQQKAIKEINTQTNFAMTSADGKNTIFHGLYGENGLGEPTAIKVGDTWFKPNGTGTDILTWTGTVWQLVFDAKTFDDIGVKVDEMEQDIIGANKKAQAGLDEAAEAIAQVDFLNDAVDIAVEQSADAVTRAQQAQKSANDLLGQVTEIKGTLTTVESVIDELNGQMALKVNTTEFNALTGIVNSHTTQIGINKDQIALKANKDYVDTINNQVESVQTELTVQAGEILGLSTSTNGLITEVGLLQSSFDTFRVTLGEVQTEVNGAVKSTVVEYYLSTSLTTVTGGSWTTTAPPWTVGKYMWSRTKIVYVNGNISYSPATCIAGAQGQQGTQGAPGTPGQKGEQGIQGNTGATGKSVSSIIPQYAMTASKTTAPTTGWTTTAPTWIEGQYIWTRSQINWTNPTSTTYTTPVVDSALDAVATKYSDLQIKVDGIQSTVSRIDGDYATNTKVNQLADQWTQTTNLANGHTGQISNLGDQINLRLTQDQVSASILSDKTIKDTRNRADSPTWYYLNYPSQTVQEFKTLLVLGLTQASGQYAVLTTEVSWTGASGGAIEQTAKTDDGVYQRRGITTWSEWAKIADTSNVLAQINLSSEGVQIQGKKVQITGETYIANGVFKTVHIADGAITNAKIANATIASAKIISLDASKITAGVINTSLVNVIATSGNKRVQIKGDGLSAIDSNGKLRLAIGVQDIAGDGQSDPSNIIFYTGNGTRSFSIGTNVADTLVIGTEAWNQYTLIRTPAQITLESADIRFSPRGTTYNDSFKIGTLTSNGVVHPALYIERPNAGILGSSNYWLNSMYVTTALARTLQVGYGSANPQEGDLAVGASGGLGYLMSKSVYNRTVSWASNINIVESGIMSRSVSARKYKINIAVADETIENAKKVLKIHPSKWLDKAQLKETGLSETYYGFIADEFHEIGLTEVVMYGNDDQVEGLAYDRISMYHNVVLSEHELEIIDLKQRVSELENQVRVLQMAS